jgi:transglutaminase-like putative cysteine protease
VHLTPRNSIRQTCRFNQIDITPDAAVRHERMDVFGNNSTHFSLQEPHRSLTVLASSDVEVLPRDDYATIWSTPWEQVADLLRAGRDSATLEARQFTFDSPHAHRHADLAAYAAKDFAPGRPILQAATDLTTRIHKEFTFKPAATTIGTPVLEVLKHKHGVCQDFAHLEIACLRSLGLAARYVSGYLLTRPPPGKPRLIGADASHAWVSVFIPDLGWIDFDPTSGVLPSAQHITLGWARDYDDICPVKGVIIGGHRHSLSVAVDVAPVEEGEEEEE